MIAFLHVYKSECLKRRFRLVIGLIYCSYEHKAQSYDPDPDIASSLSVLPKLLNNQAHAPAIEVHAKFGSHFSA